MNIFYKILPVSLFLFIACNNPEKNKGADGTQNNEASVAQDQKDEHDEQTTATIQLDNGKKWKANPETVEGIDKMQAIIRNGEIAKAQPNLLYEPLRKEFQTIFEKCTMKGEAHEQLHHFLTSVKVYLDEMKDNTSATNAMEGLKAHLRTFADYFEL